MSRKGKEWTEEEIDFLKDNFRKKDKELAKELDRSVPSVRHKRQRLGLLKKENWTESEDKFLEENYHSMKDEEIARALDRTKSAVRSVRKRLGLKRKEKEPNWSADETKFLKENYKELDKEIAEKIERTKEAVANKRRKLGLIKKERNKEVKNKGNLTPDKAYLLGYLYGDGCTRYDEKSNNYSISYAGGKQELEFINNIFENVYGFGGNFWEAKGSSEIIPSRTCYNLVIGSKQATKDILMFGPTKSKKWRVPDKIKFASQGVQKNFINGLFDSDGTVSKRGGKDEKGVVVSLSQYNKKGTKDLNTLIRNGFNIEPKVYTYNGMNRLVISKQYEVEEFKRCIGFRYSGKKKKLKNLLEARGYNRHKKIEKYKKIKELYNKGSEISEISKKCDIHPTTAKDWLGLHKKPPRYIKQYERGLNNV